MHESDTSFEHHITQIDYSKAGGFSETLVSFLDQELRPKSKHSITDEYPSLFRDFPGGSSLMIEKDGRVASHVGFLVRDLIHPDYRLRTGLIGSVATSSIFRGMGMASTLLKSAVHELRIRRCALAVLWSDQADFYLPLGFHRAGRETDLRFDPKTIPDLGSTSRPFDPNRDVEALWRIYRRQECKVDRSLEEMKRLVRIPEVRVFVTEASGQITSYIAIGKGADFANYIHEWAGDVEAVAQNIAFTQKQFYPQTPLTLIGPGTADLTPLKRVANERWEGVVGLLKILDRAEVLRCYDAYLRAKKIPFVMKDQGQAIELNGILYSLKTEKELLKVVFGDEEPAKLPHLPFFLWGFDSI